MLRGLLITAGLAVLMVGSAFGSCTAPANPIEVENCNPGSDPPQWQVSGSGDASIQGFATDISVNTGQTINFKINTPATGYTIGIFRMGYYGGLGARKVATVVPSAKLPQSQPACLTNSTTLLYDCGNWAVSASWAVPSSAVSGIYIAVLIRSDTGGASQIFFIVRNDASDSDILFQTSDETWHAYNPYGGHSLYGDTGFNLSNRAFKVSYNRPFNTASLETATWLFNAEYPMVRWLEANGYNVSYFTSVDAARSGSLITNHKIYLSVGHDEYWSEPKRASVEAARAAGVSLAFFSGNEGFWKTRWENSIDGSNTPYRTLVCYKETLAGAKIDPTTTWTGTWRDPSFSPPSDGGRPENALDGTIFRVNGPGSDNTNLSIKVPAADGKMRFWRSTAVANQSAGQTISLPAGTLGYEWDDDEDNGFRPAGLFDMSTATYTMTSDYLLDYGGTYGAGVVTHHLTLYRSYNNLGQPTQTPLGLVFGSGTVQWAWGLDANHDNSIGTAADPNMQQATVNLFADMGVQPATLQGGLLAASMSADTIPPTSTITAPANGSTIQFGAQVNVTGTAADTGGGVVGGVEVSVDGGKTWHPASGRSPWTYTFTALSTGAVNILSRAVDDSGNIEIPSAGVTETVPKPPVFIDVQTSTDGLSTGTSITSSAFSTSSPDELLLAFVATDYLTGANTTVTNITGGGLTWTLVVRTNGQSGTSEIWRAFATSPLTNIKVTATMSQSVASSITVMSFTGVDTTGTNGSGAIGNTATKSAPSGAPTASLVTTRNSSWVFGVGNDYDNAIARTPASGQSLIHQDLTTAGDTYWVQMQNVPTPTTGTTVTINDTAPTGDRYNLSIVEVRPPQSGLFSISGTISPASFGAAATLSLTGPVTATIGTDSSGNYNFAGLPNGTYTVTPNESGAGFSPPSLSVPINGSNATGMNFTGFATFSVSGNISPAGSGTTMTLTGGAEGGTSTTTTDSSGNFTFTNISNGSYTLTPSKSGSTFTPSSQPVTVNGGNAIGLSFTNNIVTYTISGNLSSNGANATVALTGASSASTTADASGSYTFTGLLNGVYTITPTKTGFSFNPASQGVTIKGGNVPAVNFTAAQTWTVSGNLTANGAGATVSLGGTTITATADSSGNYTLTGVANGTYTVTPTKTGYTFSPINQSVTVNNGNLLAVNFSATQNTSSGLAMDAKVSTDGTTAKTTVATPAFSTKAGNELLLAFIATDYVSGTNTTVASVAGGGLSWSLVKRTNTQSGTAEIWRAFATSSLTNVTITATVSQSVVSSITVLSFTGVDTSGTNGANATGNTGTGNGKTGAPTASLTTTRANSWVFGVGNDYDNAIARTPGTGQSLVHQFLAPTGDTYWVQMQNSTTSASGSTVTINDTAPTTDRWNLSTVEVRTP